MSLGEIFDQIYREDRWHGGPSRSGPGAGDLEILELAPELVRLIADLGISSVLDIGCGEGYWMPDLPGYVGIDVSIEALNMAMIRHPEREYRLDTGGPYPGTEAAICRTVIQHLSYASGLAILARVREAGIRYFIATTYERGRNISTQDGDAGYWVDMTRWPFNLPSPIASLRDGRTDQENKGALLAVFDLA